MDDVKPLHSPMMENFTFMDLISNSSDKESKFNFEVSVFVEVSARLSQWVLDILPNVNMETFFDSVPGKPKVQQDLSDKEAYYTITGSIKSIIAAYVKILKLCNESATNSVKSSNLQTTKISKKVFKNDKLSLKTEMVSKKCSKRLPLVKTDSLDNLAKRRSKRVNAGSLYKAMKQWSKQNIEKDPDDIEVMRLPEHAVTEELTSSDRDVPSSNECSEYKHFCEVCSFKTKRISHFQKHMAIHKKVNTLFRCQLCSFTTVRLGHLRRHKMLHCNNIHKCEECSYQTDEAKLLTRHVKLKHESKPFLASQPNQMFECNQCTYKCNKRHLLERHLRIHGLRSHQCELCRYRTRRKEHFVRHVNNVHKNKRPFLCHLCGKAFKRGDALRQHQVTHEEDEGGEGGSLAYLCQQCGKSFRSLAHLNQHSAVHSNDRSFLCEICGASFKTRSVQRKHVQTIHKNPRSHSCPSCDRRFNTQYALKRHFKIHQNSEKKLPFDETGDLDMPVTEGKNPGLSPPLILASNVMTSPVVNETTQPNNVSVLTLTPQTTIVGQLVDQNHLQSAFSDAIITPSEIITSTLVQGTEVTTALVYLTNSLI